jgi:hypothetical protein
MSNGSKVLGAPKEPQANAAIGLPVFVRMFGVFRGLKPSRVLRKRKNSRRGAESAEKKEFYCPSKSFSAPSAPLREPCFLCTTSIRVIRPALVVIRAKSWLFVLKKEIF